MWDLQAFTEGGGLTLQVKGVSCGGYGRSSFWL